MDNGQSFSLVLPWWTDIEEDTKLIEQEYLPNFFLETSDELNCYVSELIFTTFQVHYNFNLQNSIKDFQSDSDKL